MIQNEKEMVFIMIEINNLSKRYNNNCMALDDITCSIGTGVFGLLGENGAGKSTLLKILAMMIEPTGGRVTVNGVDVCSEKTVIRNQLGYLPQEFGFYSRLTGFEMLEYFAVLKGVTDKQARKIQVNEAIELVNLAEVRNKRISTYSFGMKQRLGFAQALLGKPQLLIMDEPTAGLDPVERNNIRNVISELGRKITIVYSTHIFADIEACCSELAILRQGSLVFQGKPDELAKLATGMSWQIKDTASAKDGYMSLMELAR
ncbi:ABC transporter ATP-binding protein [Pelosinus sp. Bkl1]|uniref:ABC transporter ATP-binding protein n=2 Tax=Pelosinus baikalensis TaxID=2892015 RepID=A0ABS8HZA8_9FIRM|nr:ABC transporter ATP-binding protein [Pelosinus baikalensis]